MLNTKQNLHIHSVFCDGKDTPREMVDTAIERGYGSIGFSIHSPRINTTIHTTEETVEEYKAEVRRLKEEYRGRIDIFCGIEYDNFSTCPIEDFDYTIGSVHCLMTEDNVRSFDGRLDTTIEYINKHCHGDGMEFSRRYFETLMTLPDVWKFDIIGHIDIHTKNNDLGRFFDTESKEYERQAFEAIHALKGKIPFFEVNTGAISRGYKSCPYPDKKLLRELRECGFGAVITSDCHNREFIDCFWDESRELLRECGFRSRFVFDGKEFSEVEI